MLVQKLRPFVTSFSAHIETNYLTGEEVCVGGKIISFLDIGALLPETDEGVYVTLDDGVGTIELALPRKVYEAHADTVSFEIGSVLLATGRVHHMPIECKGKSIKKHTEHTTRVLCWSLTALPE
jgi:hypothetical protein